MKKILVTITGVIFLCTALYAQTPGDTESLVSADVNAFIKTAEIGRFLKTINFIINNLMDEQTRSEILAGRDQFRDKSGIDVLSEASLKKNGIDTSRPLTFVMFPEVNAQQVFLMFIPVLNEKEFPAKFNEIRKKSAEDQSNFKTPVKAVYRGITIYQMDEDLFTAAFNGYFLMGSTAEVVKKAVDMKSSNTGSLILDGNYKDYLAGVNKENDINVYISSKTLASLNKQQGQDPYNTDEGAADENAMLEAVKYISMGMAVDGKKIKMNSMVRITKGNPDLDLVLDLLQTGIQKQSLNVASSDITMAMGLNLSVLDNFCKNGKPECAEYASYKEQFKQTTGIDYDKEFLPNYAGVVNVMMADSGDAGGMGEMMVFLPMLNIKKTEVIWNKLKKTSQDMYGQQKMFGEEKIDGKKAFWIMDASQIKYYVVFDQKGLYAGNSVKLIKAAMKSQTIDKTKNGGSYGMINDNTFMFIDIRKTGIIEKMMGMFAGGGNPGMSAIFSGIRGMTLKSDKVPEGITFDVEVELKGK